MKRILMITSDYTPAYGGIGVHVENLITYLNQQGIEVTLLVARLKVSSKYNGRNEKYWIQTETKLLKVVEINTNFQAMLSQGENTILRELEEKESFDYYCAAINQLFLESVGVYLQENDKEFDLIHLHDAFISFGAVMLGKYLKLPIVATMHSMNSGTEWLIDNFRRYLVNNVEKIICVSKYIQREIIDRFHFSSGDKIMTIYNSVRALENKRETTKVEKGKIVFCGRLEPVKGVDILLEAVKKLPLSHKEKLQVIIIGAGSAEDELRMLCKKNNLEKYVTFTGLIDQKNVFEYFDTAECVVLPSRKEPFATSALEAMARGCCVLASATGGFTELICDTKNGLLFENENADDLEKKLEYVLSDFEAACEMGMKAQEKVLKEYSWEATVKKTIAVYEDVLG